MTGPGGVGRCNGLGLEFCILFCLPCVSAGLFGSRGYGALPLPQSLMAGSSDLGAGARGQDSC